MYITWLHAFLLVFIHDDNQQITLHDSSYMLSESIMRARAKMIKEVFNKSIYDIWIEQALRIPSKMTSSMMLKLKEDQSLINIIQVRDKTT